MFRLQVERFKMRLAPVHSVGGLAFFLLLALGVGSPATPATIGFSSPVNDTVIRGGTGNLGMTVTNTAAAGAFDLNYTIAASAVGLGIIPSAVAPCCGLLPPSAAQAHTATATTINLSPPGPNAVTFTVTDPAASNDGANADAILTVLDHSNGAFSSNGLTTLSLDFGDVPLGSSPILSYGIQNLAGAFRAGLDLDTIAEVSDANKKFATDASAGDFIDLAAGVDSFFNMFVDASTLGSFSAQYTFRLSDVDGLSGSVGGQTITLNVTANVVPEPSTAALAALGLLFLVGCRPRRRVSRLT